MGSGGAAAGAKVATGSGSDAPTISSGLIGTGCSSYEVATGSSTVGLCTIGEYARGLNSSSFDVPVCTIFRAIFSTGFSMGFNANRGAVATGSILGVACGSVIAVLSIGADSAARCGAPVSSAGTISSSGTTVRALASAAVPAGANASGATTATCCAVGSGAGRVSTWDCAPDAGGTCFSTRSEAIAGATSTALSAEIIDAGSAPGSCTGSCSADVVDAITAASAGEASALDCESDVNSACESWPLGPSATLANITSGAGGAGGSKKTALAIAGRSNTGAGRAATGGFSAATGGFSAATGGFSAAVGGGITAGVVAADSSAD